MGRDDGEFRERVIEIVKMHVADLDQQQIYVAPSRNGNFISVTITITAVSRDQLDAIYMDLTACEQVMMAL